MMIYEAHVGEVYEKYEGTPDEIAELLQLKEKEEKPKTITTRICVTGSDGELENIEVKLPKPNTATKF